MFSKKLHLANIPTPLETAVFNNQKFLIKRDDLTGVELTGNKVRKLEYLLWQAKKEKAEIVFTCGAVQSNHARATVISAARCGLKTHLFLWGKNSGSPDGNLFLSRLFGAGITFLNRKEYDSVNKIMYEEREKYLKRGVKVYVIPEGGSTTRGITGYVECVNEIKNQINISGIKGIISAAGTGGTSAGLLLGASLFSPKLKIYAVNVLYPADVIRNKILMLAEASRLEHKLNIIVNNDNLVILDGYSKEGYKNISKDKINLATEFAGSSGILFDPAYTAKAFAAYNEHFLTKGEGMKNIFLHTGGLFGVFGKKDEYLRN